MSVGLSGGAGLGGGGSGITTGAQTFSGQKTFTDGIAIGSWTITDTGAALSANRRFLTSEYWQSTNTATAFYASGAGGFYSAISSLLLKPEATNGASAVSVIVDTQVAFTTTAKLLMLRNNGTEKVAWEQTGKLMIPTGGAAAVAGTATLVGGTVTVSTTAVSASSIIMTSRQTTGGTIGHLSTPTASITAGTSFVINSSSGTDTSTVGWFLIN